MLNITLRVLTLCSGQVPETFYIFPDGYNRDPIEYFSKGFRGQPGVEAIHLCPCRMWFVLKIRGPFACGL